jgi:hypothetical protein
MFSTTKSIIALAVLALLALGVGKYGDVQFERGVLKTVAAYEAADKKGAETINETSRKILDSIGADADADSLLTETGGLRDD